MKYLLETMIGSRSRLGFWKPANANIPWLTETGPFFGKTWYLEKDPVELEKGASEQ